MIKRIKDYFDLSSFEVRAFTVLLILITIITAIDFLIPYWISTRPVDFDLFDSKVKQLSGLTNKADFPGYRKDSARENLMTFKYTKRFYFDPNTTDSTDWIRLGVTPSVIASINTSIRNGKIFKKKEDLLFVPGFDEELYKELEKYIFFRKNKLTGDKTQVISFSGDSMIFQNNKFDLNWIDTLNLKKLKGIGSVYAKRIVKYRNRIGGFVSYDQLYEIYGMNTEIFNTIYRNTFISKDYPVYKHAINLENRWQLLKHPYFDSAFVAGLLKYRITRGPFKSPDELLKYGLVSDSVLFNKMKPYLKLW